MLPVGVPAESSLRDGVPVGAFVASHLNVERLRQVIRGVGWLKKGVNTTSYRAAEHQAHAGAQGEADAIPQPVPEHSAAEDPGGQCAVHVSIQGALAMEAADQLSEQLRSLLASGAARWVPGLRVGSPACATSDTALPAPAAPELSLIHI
eukprot:TRINITY_DN15127_c0_g1_i1.p1 TRINITY_DN15127_c0_g1~~TRINITY_DN15127_c0_g1_i1.p1  ORF type:complete len:150 (-),score=28.58 TRINITY_DN15127_c0_g1_i1:66-515(-)